MLELDSHLPERREICGVICNCGPNGEPLACGYPEGHEGYHSWSAVGTYYLPSTEAAFDAVRQERVQQDHNWGGAKHDDGHSNYDWIAFIAKHLGRAVQWPFDPEVFKRQMVKVAALAVAAIEWAERREARS